MSHCQILNNYRLWFKLCWTSVSTHYVYIVVFVISTFSSYFLLEFKSSTNKYRQMSSRLLPHVLSLTVFSNILKIILCQLFVFCFSSFTSKSSWIFARRLVESSCTAKPSWRKSSKRKARLQYLLNNNSNSFFRDCWGWRSLVDKYSQQVGQAYLQWSMRLSVLKSVILDDVKLGLLSSVGAAQIKRLFCMGGKKCIVTLYGGKWRSVLHWLALRSVRYSTCELRYGTCRLQIHRRSMLRKCFVNI